MPITHEWNGTILTITSDSGTSSADLKGEKGDDGSRGPQGAACVVATDTQMLGGYPAADYALKTDTAPNTNKLGGKEPEYYIQPKNELDNSYFINPVNQRGQTKYDGTYAIDRWRVWNSGSIWVENGYISVLNETAYQYIETKTLKNTNYTLSAMTVDGRLLTAIGNPHNAFSFANNGLGIGIDNNVIVIALPPNNGYVWAALYEGEYTAETLPPYVPKGYAAELAECQRYYYQVLDHNIIVSISFDNAGFGDICYSLPQEMRTFPSVKCYGYLNGENLGDNTSRLFLNGSYNTVNCSYQWKSKKFISPRYKDTTYVNKVGFVSFRFTASADI